MQLSTGTGLQAGAHDRGGEGRGAARSAARQRARPRFRALRLPARHLQGLQGDRVLRLRRRLQVRARPVGLQGRLGDRAGASFLPALW